MIISLVFAICLGMSSSVEIQVTVKDASCLTVNEAHIGNNLDGFGPMKNSTWTATDCSVECSKHDECVFWNWKKSTGCFLKSDRSPSPTRGFIGGGFIGGDKDCRPEEPDAADLTRGYGNNWKVPQIPNSPPRGQRCSGRNYGERRCCTPQNPCNEGEGDCDGPGDGGQHDGNAGCKGSLVCGSNNCKQFGTYFHEKDDCCQKPESAAIVEEISPEFSKIPDEPPFGQRCSGRNYGERRCCNPENPCNEGEGDCDGPADGGQHDGHAGCKGSLVCGSNNCKQFGTYFHEKDDCCQKPSSSSSSSSASSGSSIIPSEPPYGQRCSGRNYGERRCCSPENPCNEGEGDCDGPGDGGQHDGNTGCKGSLVCGSNNCKQFGTYFHEKDDCCQKPSSSSSISSSSSGGSVSIDGWSSWGPWNQCSRGCGGGKKSRHRTCSGPSCRHTNQTQERNCNTHHCFVKGPK